MSVRLKPGSTAWLLRHEARLKYRGMSGTSRAWTLALLGLLFLGLAAAGVPMAMLLSDVERMRAAEWSPDRSARLWASGGLLLLFTLMLSQTLFSSAMAFYTRRDLDLLLSSPIPASRVLAARCLALAANASLIPLFLVTPPALTVAALGHPEWLSAPLLVGGLGLLAAAAGLWLAMGLFATLGPQRTRTASQVLSALAGAVFFLASQARNWLPAEQAAAIKARLDALAASPALAPGSPLTWPAQALLGGFGSALLLATVSVAAFAATVAVLGRRFAANAAAGAGRDAAARPARGGAAAFSNGAFRATVRKELRLLQRDPALMSQVLLRLLYLVPLLLLLLREGGEGQGGGLAPLAGGITFMTGMLAGSLAWVTSATEEAPDLLVSSPCRPGLLRRAKLTAALVPVALIVILPVGFVIQRSPEAGLALAFCCGGAGLSAGLIAVWLSKPGKRAEFNKRRHGGWLLNVAQTVVDGLWAGAAYLGVAFGLSWLLLPALLAAALTVVFRRPAPVYAY